MYVSHFKALAKYKNFININCSILLQVSVKNLISLLV